MTEKTNTKPFYNSTIPEDWVAKHFEDVADIDKNSLNGNTPKDYEFEYISLSDVDSDDFKIETTKQVFANAPSRARRIVKQGDILMSTVRPNLQGFSLIRHKAKDLIASTGFAVITAKKCNNEYLFQYLFSSGINRQFYQLLVGTNYPAINSSDVRKLKILLPPLPEQKAIAHLLNTWDKAINKNNLLIERKELQKKWLTQMLLTGKKRLKGFEKTKWRKLHIKDFSQEVSIKNREDKQLTVLSCTKYDGLVPSLEYFGRKIFADDLSTYKVVPKSHFAYATNHIEEGSLGYQEIFDEALISPMYTVFKTDETVNDIFLYKLLKSHHLIFQYNTRMEGSIDRRGGLRWDGFSTIKVFIPSKEEQTSIANVLQISDKEIQLLKQKSEKLKEEKKGLMQVLLTGKKRLKLNRKECD
jgi:type I restriction enzyme S subunit